MKVTFVKAYEGMVGKKNMENKEDPFIDEGFSKGTTLEVEIVPDDPPIENCVTMRRIDNGDLLCCVPKDVLKFEEDSHEEIKPKRKGKKSKT